MKTQQLFRALAAVALLQVNTAAMAETISGITGDCTWEITSDTSDGYTLTLSGTGAMGNYLSASDAPWHTYRKNIKTLLIEAGVTSIGGYTFYHCYGLTGALTIPSAVTSIGSDAFSGCSGLTSVTIPSSVTYIGESAFSYCSGLTSVTIPNSVTGIGMFAFSGCSGLTSVTIPNLVGYIDELTFSGCSKLRKITCLSPTPPGLGYYPFYNVPQDSCALVVPDSSVSLYKQADFWRDFSSITGIYTGWRLYFNANANGESLNVRPVIYLKPGDAVKPLPVPTRGGYAFTGWNTEPDGSGTTYTEATIYGTAGETTLYAQWTSSFTLSFDANGGTASFYSKQVAYYDTVGELPAPYRGEEHTAEYSFVGWSTSPTPYEGTFFTEASVYRTTRNTTLYAQWTNQYKLHFDANGGWSNNSYRLVTYGTAVGALSNATRNGYTFTSWNTAPDGSGATYTAETVYSTIGETTLYAQWTANTYTLSFNANGGEVSPASKPVTYGQAVGELPTPTHTGSYTFMGWNTSQYGSGKTYTDTTAYQASQNTDLYARWASNDATLYRLSVGWNNSLSPSFNSATTSYTVNVANDVSSIYIGASANHSGAAVSGAENKELSVGANTLSVVVTAQDGITTQTYTVAVTRAAAGSTPVPSALVASDGVLTPAFSPAIDSYTVEVPNSVSAITLVALAPSGARVIGAGEKPLSVGPNTLNITVTDEISAKTYTVIVTRLSPSTWVAGALQAETSLHPNPFAGHLHLSGAEGCTLTVATSSGAIVHTQKLQSVSETISLERLPAGIYFIRLEKAGKTKTLKAVKR
ncbi:MAG: InlB B-repeat-containing protein [Prevotellaceae bacterium]|jgi:uncharacterized repeat protein (TIGR02543 family)|nr:InlB B-repeat-containing protein [Prevotellaceae bacterium]